MAKLSIGWDVASDPEGTIWTAYAVGDCSRPLGRAISTCYGWRPELGDADGEGADGGEVQGAYEDATAALADLLERRAVLVLCAGCGGEYPATSLAGGLCWPCARAA